MAIILALGTGGVVYQTMNMFKKKKNNATSLMAVAPVFYLPGHLEAVIILAVLACLVIVANVIMYVLSKKTKIDKKDLIQPESKKVSSVVSSANTISLSDSLKMASSTNGVACKKIIANYLKKQYGKKVELSCRDNMTKPGKGKTEGLPLPDTHYTIYNGIRKCFVYVYETNGSSLLLIKVPTDYAKILKQHHRFVKLSSFPKSKDTWYSVVIEDSWTEQDICKMLDDVKKLNEEPNYINILLGK